MSPSPNMVTGHDDRLALNDIHQQLTRPAHDALPNIAGILPAATSPVAQPEHQHRRRG